jgi:hypothetical protein
MVQKQTLQILKSLKLRVLGDGSEDAMAEKPFAQVGYTTDTCLGQLGLQPS